MSIPAGLLPVMPLKNSVIYPGVNQMIKVGREKSVAALKTAEKNGYWIICVQQKTRDPKPVDLKSYVDFNDLYKVGTLCRIDSMKGSDENGFQVVFRGMNRVHLDGVFFNTEKNHIEALPNPVDDIVEINQITQKALIESIKEISRNILRLIPGNPEPLIELLNNIDDLSYLVALCASHIEIELNEKQKLLEMTNLKERALFLLNKLQELKESLQVQAEIRGKLNQKIGDTQRQHILREQLRTIREELGDSEGNPNSEEKFYSKIEDAGMPEEVKKVALQELQRLTDVGNQSPESHIIRNYLDLLCALPWSKSSSGKEIDLEEAGKILDHDHTGLELIKKRIIQHLAVLKLKKSHRGSILLFVGPPGVGKTSLGQSIAKALGRKFVRVSVGGVRDDAEVRGHRRTYIGAMPGRIIQGIKKVGENNPVFLLDEIDKLSKAWSGDPASALLEVLDPEQNANFLDHYLDVTFDLSKVFFIATANTIESIPAPLLDRMEVIELTGYTLAEKVHIAKNHLIPKELAELGMTPEQVSITDDALIRLISSYTREAGVRELQRKITACFRGVSEKVLTNSVVKITSKDLDEILGSEKFQFEVTESITQPGVATGLAWTPVGGDILFIESQMMEGKGELIITGQLGDVMKESSKIAQSLIRSHVAELGIKKDLSKFDFHVHVPAGATPKDGPSAGVTLLSSLISLLTNTPISPKLAMTGEITLRGAILPVGGIKEKVIAAHRSGVQEVILPKKNQKDLKDVPAEVKNDLKFYFVENMEELLKLVFGIKFTGPKLIDPDKSSLHPTTSSDPRSALQPRQQLFK